jgi:hypothetical protein
LEVTPLLAATAEDDSFQMPRVNGIIPPPFSRWNLDVSMTNETPILFSGNASAGEIIPDLRLTGTLARPVPLGQIKLRNARAFLPFTTVTIPEGRLDFVESQPWIPLLDVHGTAHALDYEVQAYAFGSLDERRLILRSNPPLPQESLVQLLTTGMTPGVYAQSALGGSPVSGGLAGRTLGRKLLPPVSDKDSASNALPSHAAPSAYPASRATLHGRFELWRGLSLIDASDDPAVPSDRITFRFRLQ